MPNATWMIQGSSRGLGLEFVAQLLKRHEQVLATCRSPSSASSLMALQSQYGRERLEVLRLDVQDDESIESAGTFVESRYGGRLDRLVNCTALLHDDHMRPETRYQNLNRQQLMKSMEVNAVGNILVAKQMMPYLINAGKEGARPAVLANMSARVSSISDNGLGGWYSYRASKTALNQLTKTLAIELARKRHNVSCILLHPGTCDTDLSKPWHGNVPDGKLFTKERGVKQLLHLIETCEVGQSGSFFAWDGQHIEW
jgi:NAD(P)-dependent dehydrogenase (short-subunit alcohol dehydrogenase family)